LHINKLLTVRSDPLVGSLPLLQQQISNEGHLSGAGRKYKHRIRKCLIRNARAEKPVGVPKGIQKYRARRTFDTDGFRLKDQGKMKF
jgi:hypothetical protein